MKSAVDTIPAAAWQAIATRDPRADGRFVYGVTSTRIFCRPTCPSRRPRRDRVRVFAAPADAAAAGFRACRRCRPAEAAPPWAGARAVARARRLIDAHVDAGRDDRLTLRALGTAVGLSPFHLQRLFLATVGVSPRVYANERRAGRLRAGLKKGDTVIAATFDAGYGSSRAAYEHGTRQLGMTPGTYRRGGAGETIRAAIAATPFGHLLVAATARGVCRVALGDDPAALQAGLSAEFPQAEIAPPDAPLRAQLAVVRALLSGPAERGAQPLPLDTGGTAFEQRVWRALQAIPRGETRSYQEVARAIGRPTASRAVARACAANRVALIVPCHRVVRADGATGGYRWGSARKAAILAHEHGAGRPGRPGVLPEDASRRRRAR
jgi:AraC family transcriptional regulator of adaptative response/methylated-DNA-[protein]-cysteine methyltransferase